MIGGKQLFAVTKGPLQRALKIWVNEALRNIGRVGEERRMWLATTEGRERKSYIQKTENYLATGEGRERKSEALAQDYPVFN